MIQDRVITEYQGERELAEKPGYVSKYEDEYDEDFVPAQLLDEPEPEQPAAESRTEQPFERTDQQSNTNEPHRSPTRATRERKPGTPHSEFRKNNNFGAGIFEE